MSAPFGFPSCWSNEERMNFLFQPFSDRKINPNAYDSKMKFWKDLVMELLNSDILLDDEPRGASSKSFISSPTLVVNEDMLNKIFCRRGRFPKCLDVVIKELQRDGQLIDVQSFRYNLLETISRQRANWPSWGYQVLIGSPLKVLSNKMVAIVSPKSKCGQRLNYAVHTNVRTSAKRLLEKIRGLDQQTHIGAAYRLILTKHELEVAAKMGKLESELDLILLWLESEKFILKHFDDEFGEVYKFTKSDTEKLHDLSDLEQKVLQIQHVRDKLETRITGNQSQCNQYVIEIKQQLAKKARSQALRLLRKKKYLEKNIDQDMQHLTRVEAILDQIYTADTNQFVLQAYDKGSHALKALNEATPLNVIDSTMARLSENISASEDINAALSVTLPSDEADENLEQELEQLLLEQSLSVDESHHNNLLSTLDKLTIAAEKPQIFKSERDCAWNPKLSAKAFCE